MQYRVQGRYQTQYQGQGQYRDQYRDKASIALLTCQTGSELNVREQVRMRGVRVYVPQYLINMRRGGMVAKALFPGYVFVWVLDQWHMLLRLMHVYDFLRCGNSITRVKPEVITELRNREGPTGYIRIDSSFFIGQHVALRRQSNLTGVYAGLNAAYKARVLFTMLGTETEVQVYERELIPV